MHVAQGRLVALGVDLHVLDPDVLPEAQAHHIQVIAPVTESTRQLHKHCPHSNSRLVISLLRISHTSARLDSKSALRRYLFCLQSLLCPALRRRL